MTLTPATRSRIETLLKEHRVVLFMKGTREQPRCGFSAAAVDRLDALIEDYRDVDVLADEELRQGIKDYGNWPTIPQLYVGGELIGGADIVQSMYDSGELQRLLGAAQPDRTPPDLTISDAAAQAIRAGLDEAEGIMLFLIIDGRFQPRFELREPNGHEVVTTANGIRLHFDLASARRAHGATIDWADTPHGAGLSIHLPLAPPAVKSMSVAELKRELDADRITVIDVRPAHDRGLAPFAAARVLDAHSQDAIAALPKDTPLAFLCHHGNSSRQAGEHFRGLGFRDVYNVEGGIDAWAREIDPAMTRY